MKKLTSALATGAAAIALGATTPAFALNEREQNALALILQPSSPPPNWNLDGDRGRGWLTWRLDQPYASPLDPVPET